MPLRCDIFYVAGVVPRAAGNPPVFYQLRPIPGKALIPAAPAGDPGRHLCCPLSPVSGVLSVCCTAAMAANSCVLLPTALSLAPACRNQRLCGSRFARTGTAYRSQCAHLRFVRLLSGHPTSTAGRNCCLCYQPCIAHRNQPLPFCFCAFIIAQACPKRKPYS